MAGDFKLIMVEIPSDITVQSVNVFLEKAKNISYETSEIINKTVSLNLDDENIMDDIDEDDLFHLGQEKLRVKKAASSHLTDAINIILLPRINCKKSIGTSINRSDFCYVEISDKTYAVSGEQSSYYSSSRGGSSAYSLLISLNISGILS